MHLVPPSCYERWFERNRMQQYNWGQSTGIDGLANGVSLRLDLAKIWGLNTFTSFPDVGGSGYTAYVRQSLGEGYEDLLH